MLRRHSKTSRSSQFLVSISLIIGVSAGCYIFSANFDYKVVAFILLLTVSLVAIVFDIIPVMVAALLSALIWNFFFIPPKFTFHIGSAEDAFLFLMYFIIALINAVLTNRIRRIEKQVLEKEEKAKTIKLYNTLLNSLSHELKTPIATIVAATDNLLDERSNLSGDNRKELTENISVASLRLNQQVENLLSMSRLESGFIQPKKDWCDINELVYTVINRLEQQLKNHTVHINMEEGLPLYKLDFGLMEQVLYNLVYNASIYTPEYADIFIAVKNNTEKLYRLDATAREHSEMKKEENYLLIIVEDRGPGFPEPVLEKVFDKFYRLSNSSGGTGLGLSIVKGFVEAHRGTIRLENVPHGARFTIDIPAETSYINNLKNE
ncbi:MAG TPA: ATP-binding protein [Chitinophagaceae bacterium]|jgi:two-component system sensor histidine kinase KdpD|nr:ATP-binding protein [Chitinophagaceae bacterium]